MAVRGKKNQKDQENKRREYHHNFVMDGVIEAYEFFGKNDAHMTLTLKDDASGYKFRFKVFNIEDDLVEQIEEGKAASITFNIGYSVFKKNVEIQFVAEKIEV